MLLLYNNARIKKALKYPITKDQKNKIKRQVENASLCFTVCVYCIKLPHKILV